jgi:hypothetical protein
MRSCIIVKHFASDSEYDFHLRDNISPERTNIDRTVDRYLARSDGAA